MGWPEETAKSFIQWEVFSPDSMGDVGNGEVIPAAVFCFHSPKMGSSPIGLAGRNEKKGMARKDAMKAVAKDRGISKREVYQGLL